MSTTTFNLPDEITFTNAHSVFDEINAILKKSNSAGEIIINCSALVRMDSAGAMTLHKLKKIASDMGKTLQLDHLNINMQQTLNLFDSGPEKVPAPEADISFFERMGERGFMAFNTLIEIALLLTNVSYWSIRSFFQPRFRRRGEIIQQSIWIGMNALPIVGLIAFLIGFILALQSSVQLRQFGANIFVADLVAIAMISEMGPLITAIMVAGRSGSAITAEIASMKISEEIDALRMMGIDPIPYLIIPKLLAITLTLPLLTTFANALGILGGMVIGVLYLDIGIIPFYNEVIYVLRYKEIFIYILKSLCFAGIILLTAVFFGLRVTGGAEGVGKATTRAVVLSIFLIIVADSIIGLLFYFE